MHPVFEETGELTQIRTASVYQLGTLPVCQASLH